MTTTEAREVLIRYNAWRRYDGPLEQTPLQPEPKEIGEAIDVAIEVLPKEEVSLEEAAKTNAKLNMTRTKLELNEIETLTHLVRAKAVEPWPFQGLYKTILSKLNKMFDEEYAERERKEEKQ